MKILIPLILAAPLLSFAQVEREKKVVCAPTNLVINELQGKYKEVSTWYGSADAEQSSVYSLFVNESNKSWTIIQLDRTTACILGSGIGSTPIIRPNV